ncbi:MAG: L-serine ammonia-lyase, iron-sulfur-dependent subunit beta [Ruthenibacterium sp.]
MNISIFDVLGPVMIGPSSSHTAGAAKLARIAATLAPCDFVSVEFGLAGSLAKTGRGHGTDKALLAGALGLFEDDERLPHAFALAQKQGIAFTFSAIEMPESHENSARITFVYPDKSRFFVEGSSIGGGRIRITNLNGIPTSFNAEVSTIVITQRDTKGVISTISHILLENNINIGVMRVTRVAKGDVANCVIETDAPIPKAVETALCAAEHILQVCVINV